MNIIISKLIHQGNIKRIISIEYDRFYPRYIVRFTYPDYIRARTIKPVEMTRYFTNLIDIKEYLSSFDLSKQELVYLTSLKRDDFIKE